MAVKSDIIFKGFNASKAYVSYKGHTTEKVETTVGEVTTRVYAIDVNLDIYKDETKGIFLMSDRYSYTVDKDNDLSFSKLWTEVKKKYPGIDVI